MSDSLKCVALIPARGGSKRIPHKNVKPLNGVPLIRYTIAAARQSGVFAGIFVSTDSPEVKLAMRGAGVCVIDRPAEFATDESPDIAWVEHALGETYCLDTEPDCFSILRPTSPFRTAATIRRAWAQWCELGAGFDSLRAVELSRQHPCKQWRVIADWNGSNLLESACDGGRLHGYYVGSSETPHHSSPTQSLPAFFAQTAALEIAWTKTVTEQRSISGRRIMPFFHIDGSFESVDLNTYDDWLFAEWLIQSGRATLPEVG